LHVGEGEEREQEQEEEKISSVLFSSITPIAAKNRIRRMVAKACRFHTGGLFLCLTLLRVERERKERVQNGEL